MSRVSHALTLVVNGRSTSMLAHFSFCRGPSSCVRRFRAMLGTWGGVVCTSALGFRLFAGGRESKGLDLVEAPLTVVFVVGGKFRVEERRGCGYAALREN